MDRLGRALEEGSWAGPEGLRAAVPYAEALARLREGSRALAHEGTLAEVWLPEGGTCTVFGDTHGQFHDLLHALELSGAPAAGRHLVVNGDFVDRGAWGLENLLLLLAWKVALPERVTLLRGNHESTSCSSMYGFLAEVQAKYPGKGEARELYRACKRVFAALPLAAVVQGVTLVVHGGLFRKPPPAPAPGSSKRKGKGKGRKRGRRAVPVELEEWPLVLGDLDDLRASGKGGADPDGLGARTLATDVLWSDPVRGEGISVNEGRGVGLCFGPDVTERFLRHNRLGLVLRSHEGPDARECREDMADMLGGFTVDHVTAAGRLCTIFSAPDYPQFIPEGEPRYGNKGAYALLEAPDYADPTFVQYEATLPRPDAQPYYDMGDDGLLDSDEEFAHDAADHSAAFMSDLDMSDHD